MANKMYKNLIAKRIAAFMEESKTANALEHMGIRGSIRESGIGKLIKDLLPSTWDIGSGTIIDENERQSAQTDIIVFYREALPALLYANNTPGIYPIESCSLAIEVKTTSTNEEVKKTISNFKKLKSLVPQHEKQHKPTYFLSPIRVYIALGTNLKKGDELDRFEKYDPKHQVDPACEIICVIGKGLWWYDAPRKRPQPWDYYRAPPDEDEIDREGRWRFVESDNNYSELLYFLGLLVNRSMEAATDGSINMIDYIFDFEELTELITMAEYIRLLKKKEQSEKVKGKKKI